MGVGRDHHTQGNNIWDMAAAFYGPPHLYIWNRERQTISKQCSQSGALPGSVLTQPLPGPAILTSQYSQYTSRFNHRATLIRLHTNRLAWRSKASLYSPCPYPGTVSTLQSTKAVISVVSITTVIQTLLSVIIDSLPN